MTTKAENAYYKAGTESRLSALRKVDERADYMTFCPACHQLLTGLHFNRMCYQGWRIKEAGKIIMKTEA